MKHLYYIPLLSVLLVACNKELDNAAGSGAQRVAFNVTLDGESPVETRAIGDMNFGTYGFHIAGYYTYNQFSDNLTEPDDYPYPNIFDKSGDTGAVPVPLVKENERGRYELPLSKLQLSDDTYLSFFAWGQNKTEDGMSGIINNTSSSTHKGCPWLDIQVADAPTSQTDIVASKHMDHKNDYVVSAVDLPFSHILSKLTFKTKSSTGCSIKFTSVQVKYGTNQVLKKGRFVFDGQELPSLGDYENLTTYHSGTHNLSSSLPSAGDKLALGEMTLLPQKVTDNFISLELKYKIMMSNDIEGIEQTRTLLLKALDMEKGNNYIYTIDITADDVRIADSRIGKWKEDVVGSDLPLIAGPRGDVLLLLEGSEPPYTNALGEQFWLDHSGYNRHCKLSTTGVTYDSKKRCYNVATGAGVAAFTVPSLGAPNKLTLDIICANTGTGSQIAFSFSDISGNQRRFFSHLAYKGGKDIYFDCGQTPSALTSRMRPILNNIALAKATGMYTFCYDPSTKLQTVMRNGSTFFKKYNINGSGGSQGLGVELKYNKLAENYTGTIKYVKVTNNIVPVETTKKEFDFLKNKYGITTTSNDYEKSYISDGLILNLDGTYPTIDNDVPSISRRTWYDLSGNQFDATITSPVGGGLEWNNQGFLMNDEYATLPTGGLGQIDNYTIEFIASGSSNTKDINLIFFGNTAGSVPRTFAVYYPWAGESVIHIDSPYYGDKRDNRAEIPISHFSTNRLYWSVTREQGKYLSTYKNDVHIKSVPATTKLLPMTYCYIGRDPGMDSKYYQGTLHAIRVYNRILTKEERAYNYELDQIKYKIP